MTPTNGVPITLAGEDHAELIDLLEWLGDWFANDPDRYAAASLGRFSYGLIALDELRSDLARFAFLLGGRHVDLDDEDEEDWP